MTVAKEFFSGSLLFIDLQPLKVSRYAVFKKNLKNSGDNANGRLLI